MFDHGVLQESGPEVGNGGGVVDLQDVELLSDLTVELEFLSLEGRNDLLSQVNGHEVFELGHLHDLTFGSFDSVGEGASISGVFEESSHSGLTSVEVVQVGLSRNLFLLKFHLLLGDHLSSGNGCGYSLKIEDLSLGPVENIDERILHLVTGGNELILEGNVLGVVEDEGGGTHVDVVGEIDFFINVPHAGKVLVVVDSQLLGGQELRKFIL